MANASQQITAVSFRGVQVLLRNSYGLPAATAVTEYAGVRVVGAKALTISRPEYGRINNTGDDRVLAQFLLPPQEGVSGELRTGALDMTAEALMTGLTVKSEGERKWLPGDTDDADLPAVILLAWREAKSVADGDEGRAHYEYVLIPNAEVAPRGGPWEERGSENRSFNIIASPVGAYPWGEDLVEATDGCEQMQLAEGSGEYAPRISAFIGDGATAVFSFGKNAANTDKVQVYDYDTTTGTFADITGEAYLTIAVGSLTFGAGNEPAATDFIIVVMETEAWD